MEIDAQIAARLKALRSRRGWTLKQLAQASGVSLGMISKIERQEASATAALLSRLSAALEMPLSDLLAQPANTGTVVRKAERPRWQDPATRFVREIASPRLTGSAVEIVEVELPPKARPSYRMGAEPGYSQHVLVLEGKLRVHQEVAVDLADGDTLYMVPAGDLGFENLDEVPCRYLVIMERRSTL